MLVTFEGLDCAGKSSLIRAVATELRSTLREPVLHLADISSSPTGRRLKEVYQADDLFGQGVGDTTVLSRCLAAAADLFYFDGALITPAVAAGAIVLKERHVDTLISFEAPVLVRQFGWSEQQACEWLALVLRPLQTRPQLTILVDAPLSQRERRLRERVKTAGGTLEPAQAEIDREAFRIRAEWYEKLTLKDQGRFIRIANPDGELAQSASQSVAAILDRIRQTI